MIITRRAVVAGALAAPFLSMAGARAASKVTTRTIELAVTGGKTTAFVTEPEGAGPHAAIVLGAEAMGINAFMKDVATKLAQAGYVTVMPDYFRGKGPSQPDNYNDFTEVMAAIEALDFRVATYDQLAAADWARGQKNVDPKKIAVWGYCTGGTLSMMAASLDRKLAAAVLFFPSQPVFEALNAKRPAHAMDMVWNINCPVMVIYGDKDTTMAPERLADLRSRFERWGVKNEIKIYPGAGHAFSAPAPHMYNAAAAAGSWTDAVNFVHRYAPA